MRRVRTAELRRSRAAPTGPVATARRLAVSVALPAAVLLAVFIWLAAASGADSALATVDHRVAAAFAAWRTPGRSQLFWALTLLGNTPVLAALSFSAVTLSALWGRVGRAALLAVGLVVGWGISDGAKALVGRARPPAADALIALPTSPSMPSGHAFTTLVLLGLLVYTGSRWRGHRGTAGVGGGTGLAWGTALTATILAGLIGVSRIYLGVHWLSDVLGGWCLGAAWLTLLLGIARSKMRWRRRIASLLARRSPAPGGVRAIVGAVLAIICLAAIVVSAMADPLLAHL